MRTFTGTLASITVTSVSVLIFDVVFPDITSNLWLDLASGAVLLGLGIGLLYKYKISNGGFGALALMISIYRGGNPGTILLIMNCIIFMVTASIIARIVIQAPICQVISTRVIDFIYNIRLTSLPISRLCTAIKIIGRGSLHGESPAAAVLQIKGIGS